MATQTIEKKSVHRNRPDCAQSATFVGNSSSQFSPVNFIIGIEVKYSRLRTSPFGRNGNKPGEKNENDASTLTFQDNPITQGIIFRRAEKTSTNTPPIRQHNFPGNRTQLKLHLNSFVFLAKR